MSYKYGKLISAFDVSNSFNNEERRGWIDQELLGKRESTFSSGSIKSAMEHSLDKGLCLEKNIRSSDMLHGAKFDILTEMKYLELYKDSFDSSIKVLELYSLQGPFAKQRKELIANQKTREEKIVDFFGDCSELNSASWRNLFPNISNEQIIEILSKASKTTIIDQMVNEGCKQGRIHMKDITLKSSSSDDLDHFQVIDEQLNNNNIVGISYYSSVLTNPYAEPDGPHASSLLARRFNEESLSCEYLLRNSWGEGCGRYTDGYECDNGHVWVPRNQIDKGVFDVVYIK